MEWNSGPCPTVKQPVITQHEIEKPTNRQTSRNGGREIQWNQKEHQIFKQPKTEKNLCTDSIKQ